MQKITSLALATALIVTATTPALARRRPAPPPAVAAAVEQVVTVFKAADTDNSRSISAGEFSGAGGNPDNFAAIDANNNGMLGIFEFIRIALARFNRNS